MSSIGKCDARFLAWGPLRSQ